jgi:hypothetical protein
MTPLVRVNLVTQLIEREDPHLSESRRERHRFRRRVIRRPILGVDLPLDVGDVRIDKRDVSRLHRQPQVIRNAGKRDKNREQRLHAVAARFRVRLGRIIHADELTRLARRL